MCSNPGHLKYYSTTTSFMRRSIASRSNCDILGHHSNGWVLEVKTMSLGFHQMCPPLSRPWSRYLSQSFLELTKRRDFSSFHIVKKDNIAIAAVIPPSSVVGGDNVARRSIVVVQSSSFACACRSNAHVHLGYVNKTLESSFPISYQQASACTVLVRGPWSSLNLLSIFALLLGVSQSLR